MFQQDLDAIRTMNKRMGNRDQSIQGALDYLFKQDPLSSVPVSFALFLRPGRLLYHVHHLNVPLNALIAQAWSSLKSLKPSATTRSVLGPEVQDSPRGHARLVILGPGLPCTSPHRKRHEVQTRRSCRRRRQRRSLL